LSCFSIPNQNHRTAASANPQAFMTFNGTVQTIVRRARFVQSGGGRGALSSI